MVEIKGGKVFQKVSNGNVEKTKIIKCWAFW